MENKLYALRKKRNKTQKELSDYLQTTQQAYSRYEKGEREPDHNTLCKLADYFNVTVDYLLGREAEPETQTTRPLQIPDKYKDVLVAFHGGADDLTQEDIDDVVKYIEFLKNRKKDK